MSRDASGWWVFLVLPVVAGVMLACREPSLVVEQPTVQNPTVTPSPTVTMTPVPPAPLRRSDLVARSQSRPLVVGPTATPVVSMTGWPVQGRYVSRAVGEPSGVAQWRPLVEEYFAAAYVDDVLRVMACESGGNERATGAAGERGLMQLMPRYHQWRANLFGGDLYDPETNVAAAAHLWSEQGWWPWTCRP